MVYICYTYVYIRDVVAHLMASATGTASSTQHILVPFVDTVGVSAANAWALGER